MDYVKIVESDITVKPVSLEDNFRGLSKLKPFKVIGVFGIRVRNQILKYRLPG